MTDRKFTDRQLDTRELDQIISTVAKSGGRANAGACTTSSGGTLPTIESLRDSLATMDKLAGEATAVEEALAAAMRAAGFDPERGAILVVPQRYRSPGLPRWVRFHTFEGMQDRIFMMYDVATPLGMARG